MILGLHRLFTLGLLGSSYAASVNSLNQLPLDSVGGLDTHSQEAPGPCNDVFHATLYVSRNASSEEGDKVGIYHFDGRLYASDDRPPTQWEFQKNKQDGKYWIYTYHPSGARIFWAFNYNNVIDLTTSEYSGKLTGIAQPSKSEKPFDKPTFFWDDRCLVVPKDPSAPLSMLTLSTCDTVEAKIEDRLGWKSLKDLCPESGALPF